MPEHATTLDLAARAGATAAAELFRQLSGQLDPSSRAREADRDARESVAAEGAWLETLKSGPTKPFFLGLRVGEPTLPWSNGVRPLSIDVNGARVFSLTCAGATFNARTQVPQPRIESGGVWSRLGSPMPGQIGQMTAGHAAVVAEELAAWAVEVQGFRRVGGDPLLARWPGAGGPAWHAIVRLVRATSLLGGGAHASVLPLSRSVFLLDMTDPETAARVGVLRCSPWAQETESQTYAGLPSVGDELEARGEPALRPAGGRETTWYCRERRALTLAEFRRGSPLSIDPRATEEVANG